jgi:hypothetical protein
MFAKKMKDKIFWWIVGIVVYSIMSIAWFTFATLVTALLAKIATGNWMWREIGNIIDNLSFAKKLLISQTVLISMVITEILSKAMELIKKIFHDWFL